MKRIVVLFFLLAMLSTGCSYRVTSSASQTYRGESENWIADYKADFSTSFPEKNGKFYAQKRDRDRLTVTRKSDFDTLAASKHIEISYSDVYGNSCTQTEDRDTPIKEKQFHLNGGNGSVSELGNYLIAQEGMGRAIMIFSGPSYEMRTGSTITASIRIDGESEAMILKPVTNSSPLAGVMAQLDEKLARMQIEKRYPEYAAFKEAAGLSDPFSLNEDSI